MWGRRLPTPSSASSAGTSILMIDADDVDDDPDRARREAILKERARQAMKKRKKKEEKEQAKKEKKEAKQKQNEKKKEAKQKENEKSQKPESTDSLIEIADEDLSMRQSDELRSVATTIYDRGPAPSRIATSVDTSYVPGDDDDKDDDDDDDDEDDENLSIAGTKDSKDAKTDSHLSYLDIPEKNDISTKIVEQKSKESKPEDFPNELDSGEMLKKDAANPAIPGTDSKERVKTLPRERLKSENIPKEIPVEKREDDQITNDEDKESLIPPPQRRKSEPVSGETAYEKLADSKKLNNSSSPSNFKPLENIPQETIESPIPSPVSRTSASIDTEKTLKQPYTVPSIRKSIRVRRSSKSEVPKDDTKELSPEDELKPGVTKKTGDKDLDLRTESGKETKIEPKTEPMMIKTPAELKREPENKSGEFLELKGSKSARSTKSHKSRVTFAPSVPESEDKTEPPVLLETTDGESPIDDTQDETSSTKSNETRKSRVKRKSARIKNDPPETLTQTPSPPHPTQPILLPQSPLPPPEIPDILPENAEAPADKSTPQKTKWYSDFFDFGQFKGQKRKWLGFTSTSPKQRFEPAHGCLCFLVIMCILVLLMNFAFVAIVVWFRRENDAIYYWGVAGYDLIESHINCALFLMFISSSVTALLGLVAFLTKRQLLLINHFYLGSASLIMFLGVFVFWASLFGHALFNLEDKMLMVLEKQFLAEQSLSRFAIAWNIIQARHSKCGVRDISDWNHSQWFRLHAENGDYKHEYWLNNPVVRAWPVFCCNSHLRFLTTAQLKRKWERERHLMMLCYSVDDDYDYRKYGGMHVDEYGYEYDVVNKSGVEADVRRVIELMFRVSVATLATEALLLAFILMITFHNLYERVKLNEGKIVKKL